MVCPKCHLEVNDANQACPFCNEPLRVTEGSDFYNSFEIKDTVNQPTIGTKAYIPKKATEGLGLKIGVTIIVVLVTAFLILYFSTSHIFCKSPNGGKFGVFYTKNKIIYCFQSGQGPGDCKAINSMTQKDLEDLGYMDYTSFIESIKIQIEASGNGTCQ